jgi:methionyl-tRNA synthetase
LQDSTGEIKDIRTVISGIAGYFSDPSVLVGKRCPFVTNLEPRKIRGMVSEAMIVAVHTEDGAFSLLEPTLCEIPAGTRLN